MSTSVELILERAAIREFDGGFERGRADVLASTDFETRGILHRSLAQSSLKSAAICSKPHSRRVQIVLRDPRKLKSHTYSIGVFGYSMDDHLQDCIRLHGIVEPLIICRSKDPALNERIVSGRRRQMAAISLGLSTVPCLYLECNDLHEFEKRVILYNVRAF